MRISGLLALFALLLQGGTSVDSAPSPFPSDLPLQGQKQLDSIVTAGPYTAETTMQGINSDGGWSSYNVTDHSCTFGSYTAYRSYLAATTERLLNLVARQTNLVSSSTVTFHHRLYPGTQSQSPVMVLNGSLGAIGNIVSQSALSLSPQPLQTLVTVTNAVDVTIQSGAGAPVVRVPLNGGTFALNGWSTTNRIRLTITLSDGETMVYTQTGEALLPARLSMTNAEGVGVNMTGGSDTAVLSADDLRIDLGSWRSVTNYPWYLNTNYVWLPIDPSGSAQMYFRAVSQ